MEYHDLIDPVQKFRLKHPPHFFHHSGLHPFIITLFRISGHKSKMFRFHDHLRTCVGSHDNDRLLKIHFSALSICNMTIIKYLQKNIKHIWMSLFNLVKKNDTVWISAHFFAELSTFFIAYISGRRSDHFRNTMFFHIFGHIYTDHCLLTSKYSFRQRFGKLRFSHSGRSQK